MKKILSNAVTVAGYILLAVMMYCYTVIFLSM